MHAHVHQAIDLATKAHRGQLRFTGEPYIEHPLSVLAILMQTGGTHLPTQAYLAAVLHDTLEDTQLTYERIVRECGKDTADIVWALTKEKCPKGISRRNHFRAYLARLQHASIAQPEVLLIKMADCIHNIDTIEGHRGRKQVEVISEIADFYYPLFLNGLPRYDHPFFAHHLRLLDRLKDSLERAFRLHDIRFTLL